MFTLTLVSLAYHILANMCLQFVCVCFVLFFVFVFADFCLNLVNEENGDSFFMGKVFILHGRVKDIKAVLCGNEAHECFVCTVESW